MGLSIVANTGYYKEPYIPAKALAMGAEELARLVGESDPDS